MTGSVTVEVTLSGNREFTGNLLGPQMWVEFFRAHPMPSEPKKVHKNEAGVEVHTSYSEDSPEYLAWVQALDDLMMLQKETAWLAFFEGHLEVPQDWDIPLAMKRVGVNAETEPLERLLQYVRFEVIRSVKDESDLAAAMRNEITEEDLRAGAEMFQSDNERAEGKEEPVTADS
jgi:hypothetical protein